MAQLRKIRLPTGKEVVLSDWGHYHIRSTVQLSTTFNTDLRMFNYVVGDNVPGTTTASIELETNMPGKGEFPSNEQMLVYGCQIAFPPGITVDDAQDVVNRVLFTFHIGGDKAFIEGRLDRFPAGGGVYGTTTQNAAENWVNGMPSAGSSRQFAIPHHISPGEKCYGRVKASVACSLSAARNLLIYLDGLRQRPLS